MSFKISYSDKITLRYDKLNTKYNRLWEQVTNIGLFILATIIAYSIAFIEYITDNPLRWRIFLDNLMVPGLITLLPVIIVFTILGTLLVITGKEVHTLLKKHKIFG